MRNLYSSPDIVRLIERRRIRLTELVVPMVEMRKCTHSFSQKA